MKCCFLGVDIGSSYTKYTVVDEDNVVLFNKLIKTLNRNRNEQTEVNTQIFADYNIQYTCSTGYGRKLFPNANLVKTEIHCASVGVSSLHAFEKTIIDIGGEDMKVIRSGSDGKVIDFVMNNKCAAGTGSFLTEIAERAEIDLEQMSSLASRSESSRELNSFCTVFAKTEIVNWVLNDVPVEDIAKGIYVSIVNRISKIKMERSLPVYLVGGVAAYHPFLKDVLEEMLSVNVCVVNNPQFINSFGAALLAKNEFISK